MAQLGRNTSTWKKLRLQILKRDGYECAYCGGHANSVDHVIPAAHGGEDHPDNLISACGICNSRKRDKTVGFFLNGRSTHLRLGKDISPIHGVPDRLVPDLTLGVLDSSPFKRV